ncbi:MAG: SAM-dependent methyltransferase, partial [Polyangiaceae bacterium]
MRRGSSSRTAEWVSAWRGLAGLGRDGVAPDPIAKHLVSTPYRALLTAAEHAPRIARATNAVLDTVTGGLWRHLPLRTRAIDDALSREIANGTRQVVLLGAGLDARGYRLAALEPCTLFEVDHPATQATKVHNTRNLSKIPREIRYVKVDFEKDDVGEKLEACGFDASAPAVFVWEGVTMYLEREAIEKTLATLRRISRRPSCLLATYFDEKAAVLTRHARPILSLAGEPLRSSFSPEEIREVFFEHDFAVEADE